MTHLRRPFPLAAFALAAGLAASAAHAQAPQPDGLALSFEAARLRMLERSDKLAAARAGVESKSLRADALRNLGGPVVSVTGVGYAYDARLNVDLSSFDSGLTQVGQLLPASLQSSLARLPVRLPDSYTLQRDGHGFTSSVSAIWPLYTGGATDAVRGFAGAQTREARADADQTGGEVDQTLVERYFGAQLAQRAAALRAQAERTIAGHDEAAQKMLAAGVISRVERLQARSAYEEARRNAEKAKDDAELAAVALARTVRADQPVLPRTPLFVLSQPVEPLGYFLDAAQLHHPGLAKVAAKKLQAEELHAGEEALRRPQVLAFGTHDLKRRDEAGWVAGVGVYWTLYDSIDRDQLAAASLKQVEQAERTDAQARSDISLLVERNWRALENARRQFTSMQAGIDLAQEVVRLRSAGLREGTSTTQDLIDAETNLAKVQTERAQAANDYVQALARLLQSAGISERFNDYIARADVRIE